MSKIALSPNASGTGVFTIASPNGNTDRTLTLPDEAGTVLTSASNVAQKGVPAFSVTNTADQTVSSGVATKVVWDSVSFDYGGYFDSTTNYRYTPLVAGLYQFNCSLALDAVTSATRFSLMFVKNGGDTLRYFDFTGSGTGAINVISSSALLHMNGTTDYIEVYASITGTGTLAVKSNSLYITEFSGFLARAD